MRARPAFSIDQSDRDQPSGAQPMGKGDKRTRKGKIFKGSYGKRRPKKPKKLAKKHAGA
jgi:30S ribosomal protein S31